MTTTVTTAPAATEAPTAPASLSALARALSAPKGFGDASLRRRRPGDIELLGGIPDDTALPVEALLASAERVLRGARSGPAAFQYSQSAGLDDLRGWIAAREGVDPARVIVTNGGFHGLSLAVLTLVERGDAVAVDNPIFPLFLRALELSDGRPVPVRVGPDGLDVDDLERQLRAGARPVAVYTVPDFHNPSQGTLPTDQRVRLVDLAERYGFVVLADNPYRELRFRGADEDSTILSTSDRVVHVNTFSKTLGPGLRLGWVVASEELASAFVTLRNRQDSHTSTLEQQIVVDLLTHDPAWFDTTLARARDLYRERADVLVDALHERLPGIVETRRPDGGFFLWPRLTDASIDPVRLHAESAERGATYQQGEFFASGGRREFADHLRLAYGNHTTDTLLAFVDRLGAAVDAVRASHPA
ncbi:PLP-dependent aminotransferase family protein [Cellulomonas sp. H30R-01]|uniref:2-aminoadipate aminotransferase n=1 Tax=Cellulomonas algicola TaxID=2071633 RepID=A0A401V3S8_9CELL|nr:MULTISPECIES: PLP-dependent aminotransferase family protein [Cellulomonas]QHT56241.1 PLP-dependent aminotransferase family protein [Cellulomonas sp. H30R-01]GCD21562.1 2-aminoadipate aminotransferase [Cellulomonas algicola]